MRPEFVHIIYFFLLFYIPWCLIWEFSSTALSLSLVLFSLTGNTCRERDGGVKSVRILLRALCRVHLFFLQLVHLVVTSRIQGHTSFGKHAGMLWVVLHGIRIWPKMCNIKNDQFSLHSYYLDMKVPIQECVCTSTALWGNITWTLV